MNESGGGGSNRWEEAGSEQEGDMRKVENKSYVVWYPNMVC